MGGAYTQIYTNVEFYKGVSLCKMNGVLQTTCSFSSGTFVVTLDQAISLATTYVFEFNVVNQDTYPAQQGKLQGHPPLLTLFP